MLRKQIIQYCGTCPIGWVLLNFKNCSGHNLGSYSLQLSLAGIELMTSWVKTTPHSRLLYSCSAAALWPPQICLIAASCYSCIATAVGSAISCVKITTRLETFVVLHCHSSVGFPCLEWKLGLDEMLFWTEQYTSWESWVEKTLDWTQGWKGLLANASLTCRCSGVAGYWGICTHRPLCR